MATSYPGALDSWSNPGGSVTMDDASFQHDVLHSNHNDAIEAIEAELGTDPSGGLPTVGARIPTTQLWSWYRDVREMWSGSGIQYQTSMLTTSAVNFSTSNLQLVRWYCPESFTANKIYFVKISAASTVTSADIGIFDSSGNRLVTADVTTPVQSTGLKTISITAQSLTAGSVYFFAYRITASTPGTNVATDLSASGLSTIYQLWGSGASDRCNLIYTGQTSMPASVTLSSGSPTTTAMWFGVSS